jgi:hypothetical protein
VTRGANVSRDFFSLHRVEKRRRDAGATRNQGRSDRTETLGTYTAETHPCVIVSNGFVARYTSP